MRRINGGSFIQIHAPCRGWHLYSCYSLCSQLPRKRRWLLTHSAHNWSLVSQFQSINHYECLYTRVRELNVNLLSESCVEDGAAFWFTIPICHKLTQRQVHHRIIYAYYLLHSIYIFRRYYLAIFRELTP